MSGVYDNERNVCIEEPVCAPAPVESVPACGVQGAQSNQNWNSRVANLNAMTRQPPALRGSSTQREFGVAEALDVARGAATGLGRRMAGGARQAMQMHPVVGGLAQAVNLARGQPLEGLVPDVVRSLQQGGGVEGVADALQHRLNPVLPVMINGYETYEAIQRGDYEAAGERGLDTAVDAVQAVMMARGVARGVRGRGGAAPASGSSRAASRGVPANAGPQRPPAGQGSGGEAGTPGPGSSGADYRRPAEPPRRDPRPQPILDDDLANVPGPGHPGLPLDDLVERNRPPRP